MVDNAMNWNAKGDRVYMAAERLGTLDIPRLIMESQPEVKKVKKKFKKIKKEKEKVRRGD